MNTVTKVFIFINLLLALGVMYVVPVNYAYQEHWKRRWDRDTRELREQLAASVEKVTTISLDNSRLEVAVETTSADLTRANQDNETLRSNLKDREAKVAQLQTDVSSRDATIDRNQERISQLESTLQIERTRANELNAIAQAARATAHTLNLKLAEVEDDLHNTQAELTRAERAIFDLEEANRRKSAYLALVRDHHPEIYTQITSDVPPSAEVIRGVVAAIRPNPQGQQDLVMLTVGSSENVREGMQFIIYRGNDYIVKVRAERIFDDMVAGRVIPDTWNPRGDAIQQGDSATNKLF